MVREMRKREREKGSALVDFALTVTIVLLIMFLIVDVGRALYTFNWLSDTARRATRFAMVRGTTCDPQLESYCNIDNHPRGARQQEIDAYVKSLAIGINTDPTVLQIDTHCLAAANAPAPPPCAAAGWVQVQVRYQFSFLSPLMHLNPWWMHSTSERVVLQ
jgi:Flp pilus assembly protein TadG